MIESKAFNLLVSPLFALAGAVVMLVFKKELEPRKMGLALVAGPLFAYLMTPWIMSLLRAQTTWFPIDWTEQTTVHSVAATLGCLIGMLAINLIAIVAHAGSRGEVIVATVDPVGRNKEGV